MVPTDMLQKTGGPGQTVWVGMAGREPLSPWALDALQGPVLAQPFPNTAARVEELRAWPLWRRREGISQEATSLPLMDSLLSHLNPCHFQRAILYLCNPYHILGALIVYPETTMCLEGVLMSALSDEALSHLEDG